MTPVKIYGHRCFRGKHPENTLISLQEACQLPINGVEIDLICNQFGDLVVSHEPWLNHLYCLDKHGEIITESRERDFNLYKMTLNEIQTYDCGSTVNANFPNQIPHKTYKPSFSSFVQQWATTATELVIEIKSEAHWENTYQPDYATYTAVIAQTIKDLAISSKKSFIQSFDATLLNHLKPLLPDFHFGFLKEDRLDPEKDLQQLRFKPDFYNPDHLLLKERHVEYLKKQGIACICWTVNELSEAKQLVKMGVDGIITDYPDRINLETIKKGL